MIFSILDYSLITWSHKYYAKMPPSSGGPPWPSHLGDLAGVNGDVLSFHNGGSTQRVGMKLRLTDFRIKWVIKHHSCHPKFAAKETENPRDKVSLTRLVTPTSSRSSVHLWSSGSEFPSPTPHPDLTLGPRDFSSFLPLPRSSVPPCKIRVRQETRRHDQMVF